MTESLDDISLYQKFEHLDAGTMRLTDKSTVVCFGKTLGKRHLLEEHGLSQQILATVNAKLIERSLMLKICTVVDATMIAVTRSTKMTRVSDILRCTRPRRAISKPPLATPITLHRLTHYYMAKKECSFTTWYI
jgi:hypothetical protein